MSGFVKFELHDVRLVRVGLDRDASRDFSSFDAPVTYCVSGPTRESALRRNSMESEVRPVLLSLRFVGWLIALHDSVRPETFRRNVLPRIPSVANASV